MVRSVKRLSARAAATLAKPGRHSDGAGLYLHVSRSGETLRRRWIFRFSWQGKVSEMGLGPASTVSLGRARELAEIARRNVADGRNPIEAREATKTVASAKPTFGQIADAFLEAKASEWRNAKHRAQWRMTLQRYAAPLRGLPVEEVDTEAVLACLQPLWNAKPETASRLRGRIEVVLDAARAKGYIARNEANPARWRGHLDKLLPQRQRLSRGHHAAMAYQQIPDFIARLRERDAFAALALEFLILTAARSGEVLGARWNEIDFGALVWTVPPARMKAAREHRIPLSERSLAIVEQIAGGRTSEFVFPGHQPGKPLSSMALEMMLRRMGQDNVTVHGFRSAFRDWAGNETHFPREIAEAALAHVVGDKAEQAYRRSDALEKRRALMAEWATYCERNANRSL